jgi:hypothetical protein
MELRRVQNWARHDARGSNEPQKRVQAGPPAHDGGAFSAVALG